MHSTIKRLYVHPTHMFILATPVAVRLSSGLIQMFSVNLMWFLKYLHDMEINVILLLKVRPYCKSLAFLYEVNI